MEKTWEISGVAGTWRMTVAIVDPDDPDGHAGHAESDPDLPSPDGPEALSDFGGSDFGGLAEHFRTLVDLTEAHWRLDQLG